jgi:hypothetical protein
MKTLSLKQIKKQLNEKLLIESDLDVPYVEGNDSVDSQIDTLLSSYESEANEVHESYHAVYDPFKNRLVTEADDDELTMADLEDSGDKDKQDDKKMKEPIEPAKKTNLNVREFAGSVARLINNVDNLLEFKNTILRRTLNMVNKNYDPELVHELEIILEDEHSLSVGKNEQDKEDEFVSPYATHAGPLE